MFSTLYVTMLYTWCSVHIIPYQNENGCNVWLRFGHVWSGHLHIHNRRLCKVCHAWSMQRVYMTHLPYPSPTYHHHLSYCSPIIYIMPHDTMKHCMGEISFEVCNHTCKTMCINAWSHSILWAKKGNSCIWHTKWTDLHPNYQALCLAAADGCYVRNANPTEYGAAINSMLNASRSNVTINTFFSKHCTDWKEGLESWPLLPVAR